LDYVHTLTALWLKQETMISKEAQTKFNSCLRTKLLTIYGSNPKRIMTKSQ